MATVASQASCVWSEQRCPPTQTSSSGLSKVVSTLSTPTALLLRLLAPTTALYGR